MSRDENRRHRHSRDAFAKRAGSDDRRLTTEAVPSTDLRHPSSGAQARRPIHPLEKALLIVVAAHLIFLPWAIGAMRLWAQIPSLVLSALSLTLALWPRRLTGEQTTQFFNPASGVRSDSGSPPAEPTASAQLSKSSSPSDVSSQLSAFSFSSSARARGVTLLSHRKLLRFPIFWLGLALLTLIAIQAFNPAWQFHTDGKVWWMQQIPYITWLPHGITGVPFDAPNALPHGGEWRVFIIYASAWMTVCALWVGFTRRRTIQWLIVTIAANGVALALFGIAQRMLGWTKMFDTYESPNPAFFSSFVYKNHAGGYLLLMVAVATALGAWYYVRGVRRLEKSGPAGLFALIVTSIAVAVFVSYARGATFTMLGYLSIAVVGFVWFQARLPKVARSPIITIAMLAVFGLFLKTGLTALNSGLAWDRMREAMSGSDVSVEKRLALARAGAAMLKDHWPVGVGSGAFEFTFPTYGQHYRELDGNLWVHAHNDILEIPIELGAPGVLIILAAFAYWGFTLVRCYAWENPLTASILAGALALVAMSWGDFVFYCPAILITWCALWPLCTRWAQLEEARGV